MSGEETGGLVDLRKGERKGGGEGERMRERKMEEEEGGRGERLKDT